MSLAAEDRACAGTRRAVSLIFDGEASPADVDAVASHLRRCDQCRRFAHDVAELTCTLRAVRLERLPGELVDVDSVQ
jgi:predicted anti-sigma-YlaC factor YlaD